MLLKAYQNINFKSREVVMSTVTMSILLNALSRLIEIFLVLEEKHFVYILFYKFQTDSLNSYLANIGN